MRTAVLILALLALTGCSQIAAIAPVGGERVSEVRYAALDVLASEGIAVLEAPDCSMAADRGVSCLGSTVDGDQINVVSSASEQAQFTISIEGEELFRGSIQSVLESALEPAG